MKNLILNRENQKEGYNVTIRTYKKGTHDRFAPHWRLYNRAKKLGFFESAIAISKKLDELYKPFEVREPFVQKNLIMQNANYGMDVIVQNLIGTTTYAPTISYGEIGTGTTAATLTDTALTTPIARVPVAVGQDSGYNTAILQFFFPDSSLANTTYTEFGTFFGGSATLGSGQIFNHALFSSAYTKASGTDITVQVTVSISQ